MSGAPAALRAWLAAEPLRARLYAAGGVFVAARLGLHGDLVETAIEAAALVVATETARAKASPANPTPPAAGEPAEAQGTLTMKLEDIVASLKNDAAPLLTGAKDLWAALPDGFQHPVLEAVQSGVDKVLALAETEVETVAPKSLDTIIDETRAAIQADADKRIAALETLRQAPAPAPAA